jgi:hypothetical protein
MMDVIIRVLFEQSIKSLLVLTHKCYPQTLTKQRQPS